jgi:hypothetical protein
MLKGLAVVYLPVSAFTNLAVFALHSSFAMMRHKSNFRAIRAT